MSTQIEGGRFDDVGVLDLGAGENPHPDAETRVDIQPSPGVDVVHDLDETPWPFADGSAEMIVIHHVIEHVENPVDVVLEAARVVEPGGEIDLKYPIGGATHGDPTHRHFWNCRVARYFDRNDDAPVTYDFPAPPIELVDLEYPSLWFMLPGLSKASPLLRVVANRKPGPWVASTPWIAGEVRARFRKIE